MIQFNLLPDVKLQYVKAQRAKHLIMVVAALVAGSALALLILLFIVVNVFQKKYLSDLTRDITKDTQALEKKPDINKILTIQNQLKSLPNLHNQKPVATRLPGYITAVTPAEVSISSLQIDFTAKTIQITGETNNIQSINKYVDTLKFTKYKVGDGSEQLNAFSGVVMTSFSAVENNKSTYSINFNFDPAIFDSSKEVTLVVPNQITTRSEVEKPSDLFQQTPTQNEESQ